LSEERFKQAEEKWGLIADLYEELAKEIGEKRALDIASRALLANLKRNISSYLEGLEGKARFEAWIRRAQENAKNNPYHEVVKVTPSMVCTKVTRCGAEESIRGRGLLELCRRYCDSDFEAAKTIHPNVKLVRDKTIAQGDPYCNHCWVWQE